MDMTLDLGTKLLYAVDLMAAVALFVYRFPRKKYFILRLAVVLTVYICVNLFVKNVDGWAVPISPLAMFAVLLIGCQTCFKMSPKAIAYCCTSASLMQHLASQVGQVCRYALSEVVLLEGWARTGFSAVVIGLVYAIVWFIIKDRNDDLSEIEIKPWNLLIIVISALFLIYVLWEVAIDNEWYNVWVYNISAAISCFALINLLCAYNHENKEQKEKDFMKYQLANEQRHYETVIGNIELINRKCHDLKYEVAALYSLGDERQKEQIKKLEEDVSIYESLAKTGNIALDNILSEKSFQCKNLNISLEYLLNGKLFDFIDALDIYVLFGNALDNGIECVKKYEDEDKRYISIRSFERGDMIVLHIENYCDEKLTFEEGLPKTSKADENYHGFGTRSIRYIAEKYGGSMSVSLKNDMFNLDILWKKR